jgi:hypothetical protein
VVSSSEASASTPVTSADRPIRRSAPSETGTAADQILRMVRGGLCAEFGVRTWALVWNGNVGFQANADGTCEAVVGELFDVTSVFAASSAWQQLAVLPLRPVLQQSCDSVLPWAAVIIGQ